MSEKIHGLPKAKIERSYLTWSLWLIPAIAAAVCGYFVLYDFVFTGPTVTIYFEDAQGLQAKNTMVRYRGIKVGEVDSVKLEDKGRRVAVTATLDPAASTLARQGSIFWIVHPQLKIGAITGLRTIVAGNYVTVQPGSGAPTNKFVGAEEAPVQRAPAMNITLLTDDLGSLERGSPIYYRGFQVGEVADCQLSDDSRHIVVQARIDEKYATLVRVNSKFWNAGGIKIHGGLLSGVNISAESTEALIGGGIAFATPTDFGPAATNDIVFFLNPKEDDAWKDWNPIIPLHASPKAEKTKTSLSKMISK